MTASRYEPELHGDYLELDECADRMGITVTEVGQLVERRALRAVNLGAGILLVQPAIVNT